MSRKNHIKFAMSLLTLLIIGIKDVEASKYVNSVTITPTSVMTYTGPANTIAAGALIGSGWSGLSRVDYIFNCANFGCNTATTYAYPAKMPFPGIQFTQSGVTYDIYPTGIPGVGYILGIKDPNASNFVAVNSPVTKTFPAPGAPAISTIVGATMQILFVTTGESLVSGSYTIPSQTVANFTGVYLPGQQTESIPIIMASSVINVTATGCTVTSGTNLNIDMQPVSTTNFSSVGSTVDGGSTNVNLSCNSGVKLYEVMTDNSNRTNTSDTLSLTTDSTASGVGIQLLQGASSIPVQYGPDSPAKNTTNQFFVSNITSEGQTINIPLLARYIRTGAMTAGSANAVATMTFSYQ